MAINLKNKFLVVIALALSALLAVYYVDCPEKPTVKEYFLNANLIGHPGVQVTSNPNYHTCREGEMGDGYNNPPCNNGLGSIYHGNLHNGQMIADVAGVETIPYHRSQVEALTGKLHGGPPCKKYQASLSVDESDVRYVDMIQPQDNKKEKAKSPEYFEASLPEMDASQGNMPSAYGRMPHGDVHSYITAPRLIFSTRRGRYRRNFADHLRGDLKINPCHQALGWFNTNPDLSSDLTYGYFENPHAGTMANDYQMEHQDEDTYYKNRRIDSYGGPCGQGAAMNKHDKAKLDSAGGVSAQHKHVYNDPRIDPDVLRYNS